ncbi:transposase [Burkholderia multivorans]
MGRFVEGADRNQAVLLPECLDDFIAEDNPVRIIDAFVEELERASLGFEGATPANTGRPSYHPTVLLKIYIYGYLNRVQSSRRLERECQRNLELMWLTGRLAPDFKTIAEFRRSNGEGIRNVCRCFVMICRDLKLFTQAVVAIAALVPKSQTSSAKADGRFDRADFVYIAEDDQYQCPAGQRAIYRYSSVEGGNLMTLRTYWSSACPRCPIKSRCTPADYRRIRRWEHEAVLEAMQQRLDHQLNAMKIRRRTVEHVFGTLKHWMGATHLQTRGLGCVAVEMSLHVLAYNLKRVVRILGFSKAMQAMRLAGA